MPIIPIPIDNSMGEPLDLETAKLHLRVDIDDDDLLISALIRVARQKAESYLMRYFINRSATYSMDGFPGQASQFIPGAGYVGNGVAPVYGTIPEWALAGTGATITIPMARLVSVESITYLDGSTGVRQTMAPSSYSYEARDGGRITPAFGTVWPSARVYPGSILISATFGYGPSASNVPDTIKQAMLLTIGHLYEHREAITDFEAFELPMGIKWLLSSEDWGGRP